MSNNYVTTEYNLRGKLGDIKNIRIALVSDLHEQDPWPTINALREAKPDMIIVAGDTFERHGGGCNPEMNPDGDRLLGLKLKVVGTAKRIIYAFFGTHSGDAENAYTFIREASEIAPMYLSLGNHEWKLNDEDLKLLDECGVTLLDNRDVLVDKHCHVVGSDSSNGEPTDPYELTFSNLRIGGLSSISDEEWLDSFRVKDGFKILVNHHPEKYGKLHLDDFNMILSGHAHGGQWRVGGVGIFASRQGLLPRYSHGVYNNMVVSAGCSNTTFIPRFGNPCELVVVEI